MAGKKTSVYLADDLAAAVEASGVPLAELLRRGLKEPPLELADVARLAADAVAGSVGEDVRQAVREGVRDALRDLQQGGGF